MYFQVTLPALFCAICFCYGNPILPTLKSSPPLSFTINNDSANWQALSKSIDTNVGRSGDTSTDSIFDTILKVNARERVTGRSDDVFLYQGDIDMDKSEVEKMLQESVSQSARGKRAVMNARRNLWPARVPYAIDNVLERAGVTYNIRQAVKDWEKALPCLGKWRDVTKTSRPRDYMYFFRGRGCYSRIGRTGGAQRISIGQGCGSKGIIIHEIGHAMGLWHEQSRPDRDGYVDIIWDNIIPAMKYNFQKQSKNRINSFGITYDYDSVMHYGKYAFSRNRRATIQPKGSTNRRLGQRYGLSRLDKQQLRVLYGCDKLVTTTPKPTTPKITTTKTPISGCNRDIQASRNCEHWKSREYCTKGIYVAFMKINCCKTCSTGPPCKDQNRYCLQWSNFGYCLTYRPYMSENCMKSCGICR